MATYAGLWGPQSMDGSNGAPEPGEPVAVYLPGGSTLATLYTDRLKTDTADNPFTTDGLGNAYFFADADPGRYRVVCGSFNHIVSVTPDPDDVVDQNGGQLLASAVNTSDVSCSSLTVPVAVSGLSLTVTKPTGFDLSVFFGGRLYNDTALKQALLLLYLDAVSIPVAEIQHTSATALATGTYTKLKVLTGLDDGDHTLTVKVLAAQAGTAHAWGAAGSGVRGDQETFLHIYKS